MVIDDLANRLHECELLLDQNYLADSKKYAQLLPKDAKTLIGPKYALIRDEFSVVRKRLAGPTESLVKRIAVGFGGVDPGNLAPSQHSGHPESTNGIRGNPEMTRHGQEECKQAV
jgi:spore coat polysaccharide biosynthesis predicted glycosyltransferase SpsG